MILQLGGVGNIIAGIEIASIARFDGGIQNGKFEFCLQ
jgi:hypothetical protein